MNSATGERLRVGVVGAGIGAGYIAGFQTQPDVEVTAICARTTARMGDVAAKYSIPHAYTVYEEMLAREPLDIVAIATPNYLHHPMVLAALDAGKHVLCDKPLAMTAAQAAEMAARAESSRVKHFVPFTWRFVPASLYMKEIIDSGFLGELRHSNVRFYVSGWGDPEGPMRWQYDADKAGSGALGNLGSHAIHLVEWWLGPIQRVCSRLRTAVSYRRSQDNEEIPIRVDDTCAIMGELEGGVPVVLDISSVALVPRVNMEISLHGSEGSLLFQDDWGAGDAATGRITAMRRNEQVPSQVRIPDRIVGDFLKTPDFYTPVRSCFARMAAEFIQAIRENRPAVPNFQDGFRVQKVMEAVLKSSAEEKWIAV